MRWGMSDGCGFRHFAVKEPFMDRPKRPQPKGGSRKGIPNKVSTDVKVMIETALHNAGGVQYLTDQARKNGPAFLALVSKLLPKEINATVQIGLAELVLNSMKEREGKS